MAQRRDVTLDWTTPIGINNLVRIVVFFLRVESIDLCIISENMSAALAKFMNPAFYKQAWAKTVANAHAKYHPTMRENK